MIEYFRGRRRSSLIWVAVLATTFLVHTSYLNNGFVWLDHGDIESRRSVLPLADLPKAFAGRFGETAFYRPIVTIAHSIDSALYGKWSPGYHLTNVLLHVAATGAVALFAGAYLELGLGASLLAALVFGIHPLSWLPVGAISYRPELLAVIFTLMAVYFHTRARTSLKRRYALLSVFSLLLGLLSKETTIVWIPALIILWECVHAGGWSLWPDDPSRDRRRRAGDGSAASSAWANKVAPLRSGLPVFAAESLAVAAYLVLRFRAVPEVWKSEPVSLPLSQAIGTRLSVFGLQLIHLASPLKPSLSDATRVTGMTDIGALVTAAGICLGAYLVLRFGARNAWSRALLFLGIALAPALNIVPLPRFTSPHYGYFASVGIALLAALGLSRVAPRRTIKPVFVPALAVWILAMAAVTFTGGFRFRNDRTLFEPEIVRKPGFLEAHAYLGDYYLRRGDEEGAQREYEAALRSHPGFIAYVDRRSVLIDLAAVRLNQHRLDEADELLQRASEGASSSSKALVLYNRALIAAKKSDYVAVVALLGNRQISWRRPEPLLLLAEALKRLDRTAEAIEVMRKALPLLDETQRRKAERLIESASQP